MIIVPFKGDLKVKQSYKVLFSPRLHNTINISTITTLVTSTNNLLFTYIKNHSNQNRDKNTTHPPPHLSIQGLLDGCTPLYLGLAPLNLRQDAITVLQLRTTLPKHSGVLHHLLGRLTFYLLFGDDKKNSSQNSSHFLSFSLNLLLVILFYLSLLSLTLAALNYITAILLSPHHLTAPLSFPLSYLPSLSY